LATRVTLKQIAEEVGVSVMTVSRALNNRSNVDENTREKVVKVANRLGYRPNYIAKSLVTNKTYTIGVVVPEISHSFFPEIIRGIEEIMQKKNYQLILMHSEENERREKEAIDTLEAKRVDGILISMAETVNSFEQYRRLIKSEHPVVFYDRCARDIGATCVSVNDEESQKMITQHLIDHGYQKIAYLSGPIDVAIGKDRYSGFLKAMHENGLEVRDEWIVQSGFQETGGYEAMSKLLSLPKEMRPRAVAAVNDPAAFGAMQAIYDHNLRIPEDVAIVGFSDDIRAKLMPCPLTTIHQPAYEVGKKAAKKLIDLIEGRSTEPEDIEIKTELIIRESCGCKQNFNKKFIDLKEKSLSK